MTVVSATSGGEINEGGMGDTRRECPDCWRERDGFFYYFERRRHLVVEGGGEKVERPVVVNSGTVRRTSITRISIQGQEENVSNNSDLFC